MSSGKLIFSFLTGTAIGAAVGILIAPDKGVNTRKKILKMGEEFADNLTNRFQDTLVNATNEIEYVKSEAEDFIDKGKEKVQEVKDKIQSMTSATV